MKRIHRPAQYAILFLTAAIMITAGAVQAADSGEKTLHLFTRAREKTDDGHFEPVYKTVEIDPRKTAIIVCDMWNTMCNATAARRVAELAPRLNEVLVEARKHGVLIIHSPSGTVDFYKDTPARRRCAQAPKVETKAPLEWNRRCSALAAVVRVSTRALLTTRALSPVERGEGWRFLAFTRTRSRVA